MFHGIQGTMKLGYRGIHGNMEYMVLRNTGCIKVYMVSRNTGFHGMHGITEYRGIMVYMVSRNTGYHCV